MKAADGIAWACGLVPLVVGVSIFLAWLVTDADELILAGLITLVVGIVLFWVGMAALFSSERSLFKLTRRPQAVVLLLNYVVAAGIVAAVGYLGSRYTIVVDNRSAEPLVEVRLSGCHEADLGSVPPGGTAKESFRVKREGALEFQATVGNTTLAETADGYVVAGSESRVTVHPDHSVTASVSIKD